MPRNNVEVQPICLIDVFVLAAGSSTSMEKSNCELTIVADSDHCLTAIGPDEVDEIDVLRVRIDDPLEWNIAVVEFAFADHNSGVWGEGVGTHAVDDFHIVEI